MTWRDIPWNPERRTLRQFAGLWLVVFTLLGAWKYFGKDAHLPGRVLMAAGLVVGMAGLAWPALVRPIFVGWTLAVFPIGWLVLHLCLGVIFFGLITPLGLVFRVWGRDILRLRLPAEAASYWQGKPRAQDPGRYLLPF